MPPAIKKWHCCDGDCGHCWPKVYDACHSKKKVVRSILILEKIEVVKEEQEVVEFYLKKIEVDGFIEEERYD